MSTETAIAILEVIEPVLRIGLGAVCLAVAWLAAGWVMQER